MEGEYNVTIFAYDKFGNKRQRTLGIDAQHPEGRPIVIKNNAPSFNDISFSKECPFEDELIIISLYNLEDSPHDLTPGVLKYVFETGIDTITTNQSSISYSWKDSGKYTVCVSVIDDQNALKQMSKEITVINKPPTAEFTLGAEIPATWSFSNDVNKRIPFGFSECVGAARDGIYIIPSKGSYSKVLEIKESPYSTAPSIRRGFPDQYYGTVELHMCSSDVNKPRVFVSLGKGATEAIKVYAENSKWYYSANGNAAQITGVDDPENNTWHHVRIDFLADKSYLLDEKYFDLDANYQFQVIIDGKISPKYSFSNSIDNINQITLGSLTNTVGKAWLDAIGLSWDENYEVGDNYNYFKSSYYATHDFRRDVIGTQPIGWDVDSTSAEATGDYYGTDSFLESNYGECPDGWTETSDSNCYAKVYDFGGHKTALKVYDSNPNGGACIDYEFSESATGYVEFWWAHLGASRSYVFLKDGSKIAVKMSTQAYQGSHWYFQKALYPVKHFTNLVWYHHKIFFDCNSNKWKWYINGEYQGEYDFYASSVSAIDNLRIYTEDADASFYEYYDAFGLSWDPDYTLGDNKYSPLDVKVMDEGGDYKEVVRLTDKSPEESVKMVDNLEQTYGNQTEGTVQWYAKTSDTSQNVWALTLMDGQQVKLSISIGDSRWQYSTGSSFVNITELPVPQNNAWYPVSLNFSSTTGKFKLSVNGTQSNEHNLGAGFSKISKIAIETGNQATGTAYLDALGYSFDPFYLVGDYLTSMISYPEKTNVQFSGDATTDTESDASSLRYYWNFDDGSSAFGKAVSHEFKQSGRYNVSLAVKDNNGAVGYFDQIVLIWNRYPEIDIVDLNETFEIFEGQTIAIECISSDEITDWAKLMYFWDFNSSMGALSDEEYESGGWRKTHLFEDDFNGNAGVMVKDPEGGSDLSYANIIVKNANPLVSIYEASVLANISLEVVRNSVSKEANFTVCFTSNNRTVSETNLTFEGSEENSIISNAIEIDAILCDDWNIFVNSTTLLSNSWFRYYLRMHFANGEELVISSEKIYGTGTNFGEWDAYLNPYFYDLGNYHVKYPILLKAQVWDPSIDDVNVTLTYFANYLLTINCTDSLPVQMSFEKELSFGLVTYEIDVFEDNEVIFANVSASYEISTNYFVGNAFPVNIDFNFTIFPIIDLYDLFIGELNFTSFSVVNCTYAHNCIVANSIDDDLGTSTATIAFDTDAEIDFFNLAPRLDSIIAEYGLTDREIKFYLQIEDFDQKDDLGLYFASNFKDSDSPMLSSDFEIANGTLENNYGSIELIDSSYAIFSADNSYVPNQSDLTVDEGALLQFGDLSYVDGNYTRIESTDYDSGTYPGTYSFTDETNGDMDLAIDFVDSRAGDAGCYGEIVSELTGHKKVLKVYDSTKNNVEVDLYNNFGTTKTTGEIAWWWYTGNTDRRQKFWVYSDSNLKIALEVGDGYFRYNPYGSYVNAQSATASVWSYHKIAFNCSTDKFDWWINGELKVNDGSFYAVATSVNKLMVATDDASTNYAFYLDAVDYSWDSMGNNNVPIPAKIDSTFEINLNSNDNLNDLSLIYSYKVATSQVKLQAYNYNSQNWVDVSSGTRSQFDQCSFTLTSNYYDSNYVIKLRFYGSCGPTEFEVQVEKLKVERGNNLLDFAADFELSAVEQGEVLKFARLYYAFKTEQPTNSNISLYNYRDLCWDIIDSQPITSSKYCNQYTIVSSDYFNNSHDLRVRVEVLNATTGYYCSLDQLRLEYYSTKVEQIPTETYYAVPSNYDTLNGTSALQGDLWAQDNDFITFNSTYSAGENAIKCEMYVLLDNALAGDRIDFLEVSYSYKSNISQVISFYIFNFSADPPENKWVEIESSINTQFINGSYAIPIVRCETINISANETEIVEYRDFFSDNFETKFKIEGINSSDAFKFYLDAFNVEYKLTPCYFIVNTSGTLNKDYVSFQSYYPEPNQRPGTYDFDDGWPTDWIDNSNNNCDCSIASSYQGRDGLLALSDDSGSGCAFAYVTFEEKENGTVEFWARQSTNTDATYFELSDGASLYNVRLRFYIDADIERRDASEWHDVQSYGTNWYRFTISWDVSEGKWNLWINDNKKSGNGWTFDNPSSLSAIDRFTIYTGDGPADFDSYIDAIGFSWDPDYRVGDNKYPIAVINQTIELELEELNSHRLGLFDSCKVQYSVKTNVTQEVNISVYNAEETRWDEFASILTGNSFLTNGTILLNSTDYVDEEYKVNVLFYAANLSVESFSLSVDSLEAEYNWSKARSTFEFNELALNCAYYPVKSTEYKYWYYGNNSFDYEGQYLIVLSADDGYATSATGSVIDVIHPNPYTQICPFKNETFEDEPVEFSADSFGTGAFANESRYLWDFGDGYFGYEREMSHAWAIEGTYNITLFSQDCFGNVWSEKSQIVVKNKPPEIVGPFTFLGVEGKAILLDVEIFDSNLDELTLQYRWFSSTIRTSQHLFSTDRTPCITLDDGTYYYALEVEDSKGQTRAENITIFVENVAPTVLVSNYAYYGAPGTGAHGDTEDTTAQLNLFAYAYDCFYDLNSLSFQWVIFDGPENYTVNAGSTSYSNIQYKCKNTKIYAGQVKVTDASGATSIGTFTINSFIDSNSNGLSNEFEDQLARYNKTYELYEDPDEDGLINEEEWGITNTSHTNPDTDGDGLLDGISNETNVGEISIGTDPRMWDTDGDWLSDSFEFFGWSIATEIDMARNSINYNVTSNPCKKDTDSDGLSDYEEYQLGTHPRLIDTDQDGLSDLIDPDPLKWDKDQDYVSDFEEIQMGLDPNNTDTDQDGLTDGQEVLGWGDYPTDPLSADTDKDFLGDSAEVKTYKTKIEKKKSLTKPISLNFGYNVRQPSAAQLSFAIAFGEYSSENDYGIEKNSSLEIEVVKTEENLVMFNITTNSTLRYVTQVVDLLDFVNKLNATIDGFEPASFNYKGNYVLMINNTNTGAVLEQYELEITKLLKPNDDDTDKDGIMDGVESLGLVQGIDKIDFEDSYWYDNLTVDSDSETWDEFTLEIPYIGRVFDANLSILIECDGKPQGFYENSTLGTIEIELTKQELNCSIDDEVLIDQWFYIYNNFTFFDEYFLNLGSYVENKSIEELYGSYTLTIAINKNEWYWANNTVNFTLSEFFIERDTWVYPDGLGDYESWITDPANSDTDGDGWSDSYEIFGTGTSPISVDTDGDGAWDPKDISPFKNVIVEIKFVSGRHRNLCYWQSSPDLAGTVEFELFGEGFLYATEMSKASCDSTEDDPDGGSYFFDPYQKAYFGGKYYVDVPDNQRYLEFTFKLWQISPTSEDGSRCGDVKLVEDDYAYSYDYEGETDYKTYEDEGDFGKINELEVRIKTIAIEKANTIAIYEANTTFVGHYQEKERFNVIQFWVNDAGEGTPFSEGPNAIVIPTSLFGSTKLHGIIEQENLSNTPLWSPIPENYQFISMDRNERGKKNGSTGNVDFVVIRYDISSEDAEEVLDLLLTCIVNETLDENNETVPVEKILYAYACTKLNGTSAEKLSLNPDVLAFVPMFCEYQNSAQGQEPDGENDFSVNYVVGVIFWICVIVASIVVAVVSWGSSTLLTLALIGIAIMALFMLDSYLPGIAALVELIEAFVIALVLRILSFLGPLGWLILRAILLILIYILLALEIFTTVPIYAAIGLSLMALSRIASMNFRFDVKWWADYGKNTKIGFLDFEIDGMNIVMGSWIKWKYWKFFDLWYPYTDTESGTGDMSDLEDGGITYPPALYCGFNYLDSSTLRFTTTYKDLENDAPEYMKLTLVDSESSSFEYEMAPDENWEWYEEGSYTSGMSYFVDVDFSEEFEDYDGQWFYYFSTEQEGGSEVIKQPANYSYEIGPYFGDELVPYLYTPLLDLNNDENGTIDIDSNAFVRETDDLNFTVNACEFDDNGLTLDGVNLKILWPDDTVQSFEMAEVSSIPNMNPNENSIFYGATLKEYSVSLNFSKYYNFLNDNPVCYYFEAEFLEESRSILYGLNEENNNATWFIIFVKHFAAGEPVILGYEVKDPLWSRTWDSWENYGFEFLKNTIKTERVIGPVCDEHVLRFTTWIVHSEGTHEEIYEETSFEMTPVLKLYNKEHLDHEIEEPMVWAGYDEGMRADMYFVEILCDGHYTYEWDEVNELDQDFYPGAWNFEISVEDHHENNAKFDGCHSIWRTGSFENMWKVMWGTPYAKNSDNLASLDNFFGLFRPILTTIGFIASAGLCVAKKSPADKIAAAVTSIFDLFMRGYGLVTFMATGDAGSVLGLGLNSLLTVFIMLFVLEFGSLGKYFKGIFDALKSGNENAMKKIVSENAIQRTALFGKITKILALMNLMMMICCNPGSVISIFGLLLLIKMKNKEDSESSTSSGWKTSLLSMIITALGFASASWFEKTLGFTNFLDSDIGRLWGNVASILKFLPVQLMTLLITGLSLGSMLNIISFGSQKSKKGTYYERDGENAVTPHGTAKSIQLYTYFSIAMMGACLVAFLAKTQFGYVAKSMFLEMFSSEMSDEPTNYENYGTFTGGE